MDTLVSFQDVNFLMHIPDEKICLNYTKSNVECESRIIYQTIMCFIY